MSKTKKQHQKKMSSSFDQTPKDLQVARIVLNKLDESVVSIQSHLFAIVAISEQWRDFHSSFSMVQASLGSHINELEVKEREFVLKQNSVNSRQNELDSKQKRLNLAENLIDEKRKTLEERERLLNEFHGVLEEEKKKVKDREIVVEQKRVELGFKEKRFEEVERREKEVEELWRVAVSRFEEVERREKEVEQQCEVSKSIEKRLEELERREGEVEQQCEVSKSIEKRFEELERREDEVEGQCKALELEEKRLREVRERFKAMESSEERLREVEEREILVEQHSLTLGLREKRIDERCKAVEVREKESAERCEAIEVEENRIGKRCIELERREKHIDERCKELDLRKKECIEDCKAVEVREKGLNERCVELELKEKLLNERCIELELKEKQLNERFDELKLREGRMDDLSQALELREKLMDEHCRAMDLREKETDNRSHAIELAENRISKRCIELERREKEVSEGCRVLEVREKKLSERSEGLDLKEGLIDERSRSIELREKETYDRCQAIEAEENRMNKRCIELERREKEVSERCRVLEVREKQLSGHSEAMGLEKEIIDGHLRELELQQNADHRAIELKEKENDERCQAIELEKKQVSEWCMELEKRENEVCERSKELELRKNQLDERFEELELKERRIDERWQQMESKEKQVNEVCQELDLKEKQVNEHSHQIEVNEKQVADKCKVLEANSKMLDLKEKRVNKGNEASALQGVEIVERYRTLELKEKELNERFSVLEMREKQLKEDCEAQEVKEKQIDEHLRVLELKKDEVYKHCKEEGLREKQLNNTNNAVIKAAAHSVDDRIASAILRCCGTMDGKSLQMFLNDRVKEHDLLRDEVGKGLKLSNNPPRLVLDALYGFFPPHLKKSRDSKVKYEASTVRSSCVLLLELLMNMEPVISKSVRRDSVNMSVMWKEKMQEGERQVIVLGFLLLVVAYHVSSTFRRYDLKMYCEMIDGHRLAPELRRRLNLVEKSNDVLLVTGPVAPCTMNPSSEIHSLCCSMDADGFGSYLIQHVMEHELFHEKILDALRVAPDPAELVFKVVRSLIQPDSSTANKASCIVLLEILMKLQKQQPRADPLGMAKQLPQITPDMREEARCFASVWKRRFAKETIENVEMYAFLQFVATYKLARTMSFSDHELFRYFKRFYEGHVYRPEQNPNLCRELGLTKKIPDLIKQLIGHNKGLQAVKYIRAFMQEYHFPLAPLLKKHVKFVAEKAVTSVERGKDTAAAKLRALRMELNHLRVVVQLIKDCELELEYSPTDLELRIKQLEMVKAPLETADAEVKGDVGIEQAVTNMEKEREETNYPTNIEDEKNKSAQLGKERTETNISAATPPTDTDLGLHSGLKRTASPYTSAALSMQQEKRPRVEAAQIPVAPNITIPTATHSFPRNPPYQGFPLRPPLGPCSFRHSGPVRPYGNPVWHHGPLLPPPHFPSANRLTPCLPSANVTASCFPSANFATPHFPSANVISPSAGVPDASHFAAQPAGINPGSTSVHAGGQVQNRPSLM